MDKPTEEKKQDKPKRKPGRPRKNQQQPTEAEVAPIKELYLSELEVLRLRLFHSERERASKSYTLANITRASYLKQIDPQDNLSKLDRDLRTAMSSIEDANKQYQEAMQSAEARLGIKLSEYTFDGDTGLLHKAL